MSSVASDCRNTPGRCPVRRGATNRSDGSTEIRPVRVAHRKKVRALAARRATLVRAALDSRDIAASQPRRSPNSISLSAVTPRDRPR
ncbi:MAG: hypothetical protein BWY91_01322 [bacterium ADurb.BinA028]|nr:MAG: hypothetical protein BWY91_01322 [bacterium ADurb.BinA028]